MKIKRIVVKNLFGTFDHDIPLNTDEHITILHGPNGIGKTVLLQMLNSLFRSNYFELYRIPFSNLTVEFSDRSKLVVKKKLHLDENTPHPPEDNSYRELGFELLRPGKKKQRYTVKPIDIEEVFSSFKVEHMIPELERIDNNTWVHFTTQEKLTSEEVMNLFSDRLPQKRKDEPAWLKTALSSINICFIKTQRLLSISYSQPVETERKTAVTPSVISYSEELANLMQKKLAEYATLSQSLDRTFPTRMLKNGEHPETSIEDLKTELKELEQKRKCLIDAGFIDTEEGIDVDELKDINEKNKNFLQLYIEDVEQKLSVFDEITRRIDLLIRIINCRFLYKKLSVNKKDGFIFTTSEDMRLSPTKLSSGEQQELVLFYELLFHVDPESLILIDEPEISLHVLWQQQFLRDLQSITELAGFDILIATHSPQIIHDRWDLTVELRGRDDEEIPDSR
ncbi:AAA family ATPase [Methanococcoides methylutens]|uniref:Putative ATPase n=1 Tax=Methanococcoides methylutens MM1 TaxID=1434104 RepID=A0A0E3X2C9_METMT|nr:AAA family ATPase [Methanococcoides methylutens]AKB86184.1 putative ATPase [Methanococcoides methylutens MM1]